MIGTTCCATRGGGDTPYLYGKAPSLFPRALPSKNGWCHPFFKGKALGTRLEGSAKKGYLFESSGIYRKGQGFHKLKHMKELTGVVYGCQKSKPVVLYIRHLKVM